MGTSFRPSLDDIFNQPVGPRRSLTTAQRPSLGSIFEQEEQPPAPRPGILTRAADAVTGLGRAVVNDPMGTAKMLGTGVVNTAKDLGEMVVNPTAFRDWEQERTGLRQPEEMADFRPGKETGVRAANAASLLLPFAGRAAGMGIKGIAAADMAAGAGLGAANTPDDPGVGALLGAGMTGLSYGAGAMRGTRAVPEPPQLGPRAPARHTPRGVEPKPVPMNTFVDAPIIDQLRKRPIMDEIFDAPNPNPAPVANGPMPEGFAMRDVGPQLDPAGSDGLNRVAQRYGLFNEDAMATLQRRPVADRIFDQPNPNPAPAAVGEFPDGYAMRDVGPQLDPAGSEGLNRAVARAGLVGKDALDVLTRRGQPDPFIAPRPDPAPASRRAFPEGFTTGAADDARFQLEGASEVEASLLPKLAAAREAAEKAQAALERAPLISKGANAGNKPAGLVRVAEQRQAALRELEAQLESAQGAASTQRDALAKLGGEAPAPVTPGRPQPAASAVPPVRDVQPPAPLTPRASAAPVDAPPVTPRVTPAPEAVTPPMTAPMTAPMTPPRPSAAPDNIPPAAPVATPGAAPAIPPAIASAPEIPGGRPQLPPSERGEVNWRTWLDQDAPGAKSVEARLQQLAPPEKVQAARGYESMNATYARSLAAAKELVDDNGLQTLDAKKVRAFVERHGEAAIPALKQVAGENASVMDQAAKAMNNPLASADEVAAATQVYESAMRQTDELLGNIVKEQARTGRSLNALKIQAKLSSDPDTWLVHAKRALGDQPMSDEIMASVRRLAREAADACGGG